MADFCVRFDDKQFDSLCKLYGINAENASALCSLAQAMPVYLASYPILIKTLAEFLGPDKADVLLTVSSLALLSIFYDSLEELDTQKNIIDELKRLYEFILEEKK